jgi:hypothetical protein
MCVSIRVPLLRAEPEPRPEGIIYLEGRNGTATRKFGRFLISAPMLKVNSRPVEKSENLHLFLRPNEILQLTFIQSKCQGVSTFSAIKLIATIS